MLAFPLSKSNPNRYGIPEFPRDAWLLQGAEWFRVSNDGTRYGAIERDEKGVAGLRGEVYARLKQRYALPPVEKLFRLGGLYVLHEYGGDWVASVIMPKGQFADWYPPQGCRGVGPLNREDMENLATLPPALHAKLIFSPTHLQYAFQGSGTTVAFSGSDCYLVAGYAKPPQEYWARP